MSVSLCLCLSICLFASLPNGHCRHRQKIFGSYGLEHYTVEINGDDTMRDDKLQPNEDRATRLMDTER